MERSEGTDKSWHCTILFEPVVGGVESFIDFVHRDEILLHIKLRWNESRIVVNDCKSGVWGAEIDLGIINKYNCERICLFVSVISEGIRIEMDGAGYLIFSRDNCNLSSAEIKASGNVSFTVEELNLKIVAPQTQSMAEISCEIDHVDMFHASGRLFSSANLDSTIVANVDGRCVGEWTIAEFVGLEKPSVSEIPFRLVFPRYSFISDGMEFQVFMRTDRDLKQLSRKTVKTTIVGEIDKCSETGVRGWVRNPLMLDVPLDVSVFLNDAYQGTISANRLRSDIEQVCPSASRSGFQFRFGKTIFTPVGAEVKVSVKVHNSDIEIDNSPWYLARSISVGKLRLLMDSPAAGIQLRAHYVTPNPAALK